MGRWSVPGCIPTLERGNDPDHVRSMLEGLGTSEIEELGERLFDAKSLEEIREWAEKKCRVQ